MKLTKAKLRQIIKEELETPLREERFSASAEEHGLDEILDYIQDTLKQINRRLSDVEDRLDQ